MVDARVFKALSDPTRLKILRLLSKGVMTVTEIVKATRSSQPATSRHLRVLKEAGLIEDIRRGKWVEYRMKQSVLQEVSGYIDTLLTGASASSKHTPTREKDMARKKARKRQPAAREFVIEQRVTAMDDYLL